MAFSQAELDTAVQQAFTTAKDIPPDHRGAVLFSADENGAKVIAAERLGPDSPWMVTGEIDHPWTGGLDYGVTIGRTW